MRQRRTFAAFLVASTAMAAMAEAGNGSSVSLSNMFQMPPAEALGAAVGAVASVNLAAWLRRRKDRRDDQ